MADRHWMELSRVSELYVKGVKEFIRSAYIDKDPQSKIKCPCRKCRNTESKKQEVI